MNEETFNQLTDKEVTTEAGRSGGPGGQHVNTRSTAIILTWTYAASRFIDHRVKTRLQRMQDRRISSSTVRIQCSNHRSPKRNRDEGLLRLKMLIEQAEKVPAKRKKTRPTLASKKRMQEKKRQRSARKAARRPVREDH